MGVSSYVEAWSQLFLGGASDVCGRGFRLLGVGLSDRTSRRVQGHDVEAAVSELQGEGADEEEEEGDQSPLAAGGVHVLLLNHEPEVGNHAQRDAGRQQESNRSSRPAAPRLHLQGQDRLHPAEQRAQAKGQRRAQVMDEQLREELEVPQQTHPTAGAAKRRQAASVQPDPVQTASELQEPEESDQEASERRQVHDLTEDTAGRREVPCNTDVRRI